MGTKRLDSEARSLFRYCMKAKEGQVSARCQKTLVYFLFLNMENRKEAEKEAAVLFANLYFFHLNLLQDALKIRSFIELLFFQY